MKDFTLSAYRSYLQAIAGSKIPFLLFHDFMTLRERPERFCLIRHDVDRFPKNALRMARLELEMNIVSTYYFRIKKHTFDRAVIGEIEQMGHEIGYHYESLSDANGDFNIALEDFKYKLALLREVAKVRTCSMHGRPFRAFDNRDLWRNNRNHTILRNELDIVGEVYLDVDYTDIAYINDTGRNWTSKENNKRDKVYSKVEVDFSSGADLLRALQSAKFERMVFQVHPERWSYDVFSHSRSLMFDTAVNLVKKVI